MIASSVIGWVTNQTVTGVYNKVVADGLTNRAIAEQLVISERSAESHVERIRLRLGFRSRAQIAAWFVANGAGG